MEEINNFFQRLFSFSYNEAKGFKWLSTICLVALTLLFIPDILFNKPIEVSSKDAKMLDSLVTVLENKSVSDRINEYFKFNPNTLSIDILMLLGLDEEVAERVHSYLEKGGVYNVKTDFKKIYGLSDQLYSELVDFVDLPGSLLRSSYKKPAIPVDINDANVIQLKESI